MNKVGKNLFSSTINSGPPNIGLPESGLLIWHIDESIINGGLDTYSINSDISNRGIDLEEADGAQDIGYVSLDIFNDPSSGWFGDMWFKGNTQYVYANPFMADIKPSFGPDTYPSTKANDGSPTFINISEISKARDTMKFFISNTYLVNNYPDTTFNYRLSFDINDDGENDFIGGLDSIYLQVNDAEINRDYFHNIIGDNFNILLTKGDDRTTINIFEEHLDSLHHFQYDYIISMDSIFLSTDIWYDTLFYAISNDDTSIEWKTSSQWDSHIKRVFSSPNNFSIDQNNRGITVESFSESIKKWERKRFQYIAGIDIDLDAKGDLLALDTSGFLYAFNSELILMPSFPLDIRLAPPILSQNILGDNFPEIIAKSIVMVMRY